MTSNLDHDTPFVSPPAPEPVRTPAVDDGAEAMRRLRDPFAVPPARPQARA